MVDPTPRGAEPADGPVLLIADGTQTDREALADVLRQRYGSHYRIMTADSAETGLETLDRLGQNGDEVALVAADRLLPEIGGVEFLARVRAMHRLASRVLLMAMDERGTRIPLNDMPVLQQATALGRIDMWMLKGFSAPEELVYPQVQEAITAWTRANRPRHEVLRVIGEQWAPKSHALRDALARNTVPFGFYTPESDEGRRFMREFDVDTSRLPAVILHNGSVLHEPTPVEVAEAIGVRTHPSSGVYDLVILGAGPAGLSAAVYGASEGLRTVVLEPQTLGGQAATSSMIRNYLGFPRGVGGGELAFRAWEQAMLFGAQFVMMQKAVGLTTRGNEHAIAVSDGSEVLARSVIIAAGVDYRRLGIPALDRLVGAGVFYGAAGTEAPSMEGGDVYIVGGANSAGQAALHLAKFAAKVTLLVRGDSLAAGMSEYLITQIQATANLQVRLGTQVVDGRGETRLEALSLKDIATGRCEEVNAAGLFVMIGAAPRTEWLADLVQRDSGGYILTGAEIPPPSWLLERPPLPFEASIPGVFAVGDVRHGSIKRVAGAVGEGSVAVGSVHRYLAESSARTAAKS